MTSIDLATLHAFLERIGVQAEAPHELVLLGGSALLLLGSPRSTVDIDYVGHDIEMTDFQRVVANRAEMCFLSAMLAPSPVQTDACRQGTRSIKPHAPRCSPASPARTTRPR